MSFLEVRSRTTLDDYYSEKGGYFLKECPEFDRYRDPFEKYMAGKTIMIIEARSCYHVEDVHGFVSGRNWRKLNTADNAL